MGQSGILEPLKMPLVCIVHDYFVCTRKINVWYAICISTGGILLHFGVVNIHQSKAQQHMLRLR